jgi:hypothetical protein
MKSLVIFLGILFLFSCKQSPEDKFVSILNDTFLSITDTAAYQYHTFFLTPGNEAKQIKAGPIKICIEKKIENAAVFEQYLKNELDKKDSLHFNNILKRDAVKNPLVKNLHLAQLKNTGRYNIVNSKDCTDKNPSIVGSIKFYQPIMENEKAIIFASIWSSEKAGVTNAYLLLKRKNKWNVEIKVELERW